MNNIKTHNNLLKNPKILELINLPSYKRLQKISFLGILDYFKIQNNNLKPFKVPLFNRYTHSLKLTILANYFAKLTGIKEKKRKHLIFAVLLHDIGHPPFSHSLEYGFEKKFGLNHHLVGENLIKGSSEFSNEIYIFLKKHKIDIKYIFHILEKSRKKEYIADKSYFIMNNPINIDVIDGVTRIFRYNSLNLPYSSYKIVESLAQNNTDILDTIWLIRDKIYKKFMNNKYSVKLDIICKNFVINYVNEKNDYFLTDKEFIQKYNFLDYVKNQFKNNYNLSRNKRTFYVNKEYDLKQHFIVSEYYNRYKIKKLNKKEINEKN